MLSTFGSSSFKERRILKFSPIHLTMFTYSINDRSTTNRTPKVIHLACQTIQRAQNCLQNLLDILNQFFVMTAMIPMDAQIHAHACVQREICIEQDYTSKSRSKEIIWVSRLYISFRRRFLPFAMFFDVFRTTDYKLLTGKNIVNKLKFSPLKPPIEQIKRQNVLADKPHPVQ